MRPLGLPVLTYHAIETDGAVTSTDPSWFAETLHALSEAGFRCLDLEDWIAAGRPEVAKAYALTFDDGLSSIRRVAEVLARFNATATVFLVTGRVGLDNAWPGQPGWVPRSSLLGWSELEGLRPYGFRYAAHSQTHCRLDRCDDHTLEAELRGSRDAVEDHLGQACRLFAYPYGIASTRVRAAARRHFLGALGTRLDLTSAGQPVDALSRIDAYYLRDRAGLNRLVTGAWQGWLPLRRSLRGAKWLAAESIGAITSALKGSRLIQEESRIPSTPRGNVALLPCVESSRELRF